MNSTNTKPTQSEPQQPGPREARLAEMLRVDHAGEYGAVAIYRGQQAVFGALPHKQDLADMIEEMEAGEHEHLNAFNKLLIERKIRPTLLTPFWNVAGFGLGAATALMGEKAAMACTAAVEDVIEKHYGAQAEILDASEPELAATIRQFREEEIGHKTIAEDAGAADTPGYTVLSALIKMGCRVAINVAEKI